MSYHFSLIPMQKIIKGQSNEFLACSWLIKNNYLVYFKTQDNDPMDLIAVHRITGETKKIDVKTVSIRRSGPKKGTKINRVASKYQKKLGVVILYVYEDGKCEFSGKN